jgi:signal transduction histidine kinase
MERRPPLTRGGADAVVAGVASGLARHIGIDAVKVRLVFAALTIAGGSGVLLYAAFWAVLPRSLEERRTALADRTQVPALAALALGGLLLLREIGWASVDPGLWPVLVVGAGVALMWHQADEASRARWLGEEEDGWGRWLRIAGGVLLLLAGAVGFLASRNDLAGVWDAFVAILVVVAGLGLMAAPWWRSLVEDLRTERRERIRSQERAELAAHLHDSVLQTLALIQRRSDSPADVQRLARSQERELRAWLYAREDPQAEATLAGAVQQVAADVEDRHGVPVEVVTVGDRPLDARLEPVVAAAREAMVNAAKFAGVDHVDVFVEVDDEGAAVYVRDTGTGFDPDAVPADRRGIAESIVGRMARHGGSAYIRSTPGEGTEVELVMPS